MAGSKGGKNSKSKGKHKSKKPEPLNSNIDLEKISDQKNSKDKNHNPHMNSSMTSSRPQYTEKELKQFLLAKVEWAYYIAKRWLLESGYGPAEEVDRAILNAGSITDAMDIHNNILSNLLSFIEGKFEPKKEAFKDKNELYNTVIQNLVFCTMEPSPEMKRADAMWILARQDWGSLPPKPMKPGKNEIAEKVPNESNIGILKRVNLNPTLVSRLRHNVPIIANALQEEIGDTIVNEQAIPNASSFCTSIESIISNSDFDSITPELVDLVKSISKLYEDLKNHKEWAERKVIDSAKKVSNDLLELKTLRMEKNEKISAEKDETQSSLKIVQIEKSLRCADRELDHLNRAVRRLEIQNAEIRADIEAFKLNASESDRDMKAAMKKQRKIMNKLAEIEKQKSIFKQQCEAEKQRVLQLELELLEADKKVEESEIQWKQEILDKKHMLAMLDEEIKMAEIQKANSRVDLLKLRQKVKIESQLARDDCLRLEDELSSLQMPDVHLEDDIFMYQSLEGTSSESYEKISHWNCMICIDTEVDVLLLPCTHQVVCFSCYEERCKVRGKCPYCGVHIEQSIRVYNAST